MQLLNAVHGHFGISLTRHTGQGLTNDETCLCVDTLRTVTLPLLKHFGIEQVRFPFTLLLSSYLVDGTPAF